MRRMERGCLLGRGEEMAEEGLGKKTKTENRNRDSEKKKRQKKQMNNREKTKKRNENDKPKKRKRDKKKKKEKRSDGSELGTAPKTFNAVQKVMHGIRSRGMEYQGPHRNARGTAGTSNQGGRRNLCIRYLIVQPSPPPGASVPLALGTYKLQGARSSPDPPTRRCS